MLPVFTIEFHYFSSFFLATHCKGRSWYSFPDDPQSNGITECMVGVVKKTLSNLTFAKDFGPLELETYLAEVTSIVNNRPLFKQDGNLITPSHLIMGRSVRRLPTASNAHLERTDRAYVQIQRCVNGF